MDRKTKTIWQLDSPFTKPQWSEISPEHQDVIFELLCRQVSLFYTYLLSPVGLHRLNHITPSKGKRNKKRKRKTESTSNTEKADSKTLVPPAPEISQFILVGLNSVLRNLELHANLSKKIIVRSSKSPRDDDTFAEMAESSRRRFAVIIVLNQSQPSRILEHLSQLIITASMAYPDLPMTRLLILPKSSGARLCESLGLARVSTIGILDDAPSSSGLIGYVRKYVAEVRLPWLEEVKRGSYLPTNINAIKTLAPEVTKKCKGK